MIDDDRQTVQPFMRYFSEKAIPLSKQFLRKTSQIDVAPQIHTLVEVRYR